MLLIENDVAMEDVENGDESMVQNSDIRYAESINLTGYVIENESIEDSGTNSDIDKQNNHRGTGKISQALGKLWGQYLPFDMMHQWNLTGVWELLS